jgi:ATP-binding cassette subfamily F protein 3
MEIKNLSFGYDKNDLLFEDLSFSLAKGDCVGIIGKNGKGKSTLLNVLAGELTPLGGSIWKAPGVAQGHFGQTNIERLYNGNTVAKEVSSANEDLSQTQIRSICGAMMFPGEDADKSVSVLSGGEKARVMLGKILATPANILLLDEPTNHLDMESIEVLSEELKTFNGSAFIVTHSELLLKNLVNKLIVFKNGEAFYFEGSYKDFLQKIGWEDEVEVEKPVKKVSTSKKPQSSENKTSNNKIKEQIEQVEADIVKLEEFIEKYELLCQEKSGRGEEIHEESAMLGKLNKKVEDKFLELESLSEELS